MPLEALLLNPATRRSIDSFINQPAHALLLIGEQGSGKPTIALAVAAELLKFKDVSELKSYANFLHIAPDGLSISIDDIRNLKQFLRLKTIGHTEAFRRAIIIEDAHLLTIEAQNALLKVLEEPPADTLIILTAIGRNALLETVSSRSQVVTVAPVSLAQAESYYSKTGNKTEDIKKAYFLSQGCVGLLSSLLTAEETHPLAEKITEAKALLGSSSYERLCQANTLSKNKDEFALMLTALYKVAHAALRQTSDSPKAGQRWGRMLGLISQAESALQAGANPKLVATQLLLNV